MRKLYLIFAVITVIGGSTAIFWRGKESEDKREYWGSVKIAGAIDADKKLLEEKSDDARLIQGVLYCLGEYGTTDAVNVIRGFLDQNEKLLPKSAPELQESDLQKEGVPPMTAEEKVIEAITNLIASGIPQGELVATDAIARVKAKYQGTAYGEDFTKKLDHAFNQGKALADFHVKTRSKPIITR